MSQKVAGSSRSVVRINGGRSDITTMPGGLWPPGAWPSITTTFSAG